MIFSLFLALTLGAAPQPVVSCSLLSAESQTSTVQSSHLYGARLSDWEHAICEELLQEFDDVTFSVLSNSQRGKINKTLKGKLAISPLRAGRVKVVWDAGKSGSQTYWLKVAASKEVWVFKKRLKKYERVSARDVARETVDVAKMMGIKETVDSSPVGKVVTSQVRGGDVVTLGLIEEPPLISRQDEITISARAGALSIVTKGVALDNAWKEGETLQVKVHGATEAVRAIVTGEKQAYVEI